MSPVANAVAAEAQSKLISVRNTFLHLDSEAEDSTPSGSSRGPGTPQRCVPRSITAPAEGAWSSEDDSEEWPVERRVERLATFDDFDSFFESRSPTPGTTGSTNGGADKWEETYMPPEAVADCQGSGAYMDANVGYVAAFPGTFFVAYDAAGNVIHYGGYQMSQFQLNGMMYSEPYVMPAPLVPGDVSCTKDDSQAVGWTSSESSTVASARSGSTKLAGPPGKLEPKPKPAAKQTPAKPGKITEMTTVMLKNLPNNYTRAMLLELIDSEGFQGKYDFLYLPIDFRTHAALGYAFVNFVASADAEKFHNRMDGFSRWMLPSNKVCCVGWSHPHQGLDSNVQRYRNSPLMHEAVPDEYRPIIFKAGERVPFPPPTKKVKPPRQGTERMLV